MNKERVIVATDGLLDQDYAKTAHGLIRKSDRYEVVAIIDKKFAGRDAGEILDGQHRNLPIYPTIEEALIHINGIQFLIIGVATVGGVLSASLTELIVDAIKRGLGIVNGLHDLLCDHEEIANLARQHNAELMDIRKPRPVKDLKFWTGDIYEVDVPIIAFLAMDCAMGKRTTAQLIVDSAIKRNLKAEMIYTGQTGWMQGGKYGFIFDSTANDFISGELENAILKAWRESKPDMILLEGQSSLRNPSGPCGPEFILSGNAKKVILSHAPYRKHFDDNPKWGEIPSVATEIEIIEKFGARVIALAINTYGLSKDAAIGYKEYYGGRLNIPVVMPVEEGVNVLIEEIFKK